MNRSLDVYVDDTLVGQLTDENNIWGFEYAPSWLKSETRHPLSPHIPLQEGK
jgi:serine/threonine-protein kinase HipA